MPNEVEQVVLKMPDHIVMAAYMVFLIGMGLYFRKFAQQDIESYFLAGRKMRGWMTGVSYASTCMNSDVASAYCGMTVICGMFICWWYFSRFGLALMIGGILFATFWRRLKIFTSPEFYEMRFVGGPAVAMRSWVSLRSAFIAVVAWTGCGLLGLHKVASVLLGWEKWETFAVVIPVILFYVLLSGYVGVVYSDLIQALIMIAASVSLMVLVLADFGGPAGLYTALVDQWGEGVVSWHPPASHELLGVLGVVAWTIGTAVGYGGDVAPMAGAMEGQRLLSCKNTREATKMYLWTEVVLFFMLAVLTLPALGAMVKWPGLYDGRIDKELAYAMLLGHYLPTGLLGLTVIAMAAAIMSTVDSNMNFGSQVFLNDVYRRFLVRGASMKHYMNVGRVVALVIMGLSVLVATKVTSLIDVSVFMLGLSSAELTANWGQWWWWRFNGPARLAASFGGPAIYLVNLYVFKYVLAIGPNASYVVVLLSIGLTTILWVVVALLTRPEPEETLVAFYRKARPLGWWGPIARKAGVEPLGWRPIVRGLGIAVVGAVMVSAGIVALSSLYIGRWGVAGVSAATCLTAGVYFKLAFGRFMAFLGVQEEAETRSPSGRG